MKIAKKNEMKVTLFVMVLIMTFVVTFVSVSVNFGYQVGFIAKWMKSWGLAFVVAPPAVMAVMPIIKKKISKYVVD
jgi:hypothetical protein